MCNSDDLRRLLQLHLARRRDVQIQDVYKLLYQGVFGAEHILHNVDRARVFLEEEWERTAPNEAEVLTESVSLVGDIIRVNISRCRAEGIHCADLWLVFQSSNEVIGNTGDLRNIWQEFSELSRLELLPFDHEAVLNFGRQVEQEGFPARHHSEAYRQANRPAYRVVKKHEFDALGIHTEDDGL
jgi:hypothetical protein